MTDFFKLVHNENVKIYVRARTWVMLGILAFLSAIVPVLIYLAFDSASAWDGIFWTFYIVFYLNVIFAVIVAADSVAGEFSAGTIKLLLVRPWSRTILLLSKYMSVILFSLASTVISIGFSMVTSFLFLSGTSDFNQMLPNLSSSEYIAVTLLSGYVDLFVLSNFAFMLSAVLRSGGLSIGLSIFILMMQKLIWNILSVFLTPDQYGWTKYVLFNNMDLSQYMITPIGPGNMTLGFSATVLAVYCLVFIAIGWIVFIKRDVTA